MVGVGFATIARRYGVGRDSIRLHKRNHIDREAWSRVEVTPRALTTLERVELQASALETMVERGLKSGKTNLAAIGELRRLLELVAKLKRELMEVPEVNVLVLPDFVLARRAIMAALDPFPEARAAVAHALAAFESGRLAALPATMEPVTERHR